MSEHSPTPWRMMRPTSRLRLARPPYTTTEPDRLQQEWQDITNGNTEWRDVPVVIVDLALAKATSQEG